MGEGEGEGEGDGTLAIELMAVDEKAPEAGPCQESVKCNCKGFSGVLHLSSYRVRGHHHIIIMIDELCSMPMLPR
jgi:hypothetical protein